MRGLDRAHAALQTRLTGIKGKIAAVNAQIKNDQSAVEFAKTQLSYTRLVAPFDGVAGFRLLDVGNVMTPPRSTAAIAVGFRR